MVGPGPGKAPTKVPSKPPRNKVGIRRRYSRKLSLSLASPLARVIFATSSRLGKMRIDRIRRKASGPASIPTIITINGTPSKSQGRSKTNRMPPKELLPIVAISRPIEAPRNARVGSRPTKLPTIDNPNTPTAKSSEGPNFNPNQARLEAAKMKISVEMMPPVTPATMEIVRARRGLPAVAMGAPSRIVMTAAVVPGVRIRIAGIDPPYSAAE